MRFCQTILTLIWVSFFLNIDTCSSLNWYRRRNWWSFCCRTFRGLRSLCSLTAVRLSRGRIYAHTRTFQSIACGLIKCASSTRLRAAPLHIFWPRFTPSHTTCARVIVIPIGGFVKTCIHISWHARISRSLSRCIRWRSCSISTNDWKISKLLTWRCFRNATRVEKT